MNLPENLATVILAAGAGKRMRSSTPKILHRLFDKPLIQYVMESVKKIGSRNNIVVLSPQTSVVSPLLKDYHFRFVIQEKPLGTAHALKVAKGQLKDFKGTILVLNGDTPLIEADTLKRFLRLHMKNNEDISFISFIARGNHSYGRVIREGDRVITIVEDKDATKEQKRINEVNSGIYAIRSEILKLLDEVKLNKKKKEYYLTDIVGIAVKKGFKVNAYSLSTEAELTGINTRQDLYKAGIFLRDKIIERWMNRGVSFLGKDSTYIHPDVRIGEDTIIYPNVFIEGNSVIGKGCVIYPNTRIVNSKIGDCVVIKDSTLIESSVVKEKTTIGPFAHIRPESIIGRDVKIGNFVEIKKSIIGSGTKAAHLSYIGDAEIGEDVNIGAGTITCNYDGKRKHKTIIEDQVFIGSDTQLVAPVRICKGAYVGAGSTITNDVPPLSLAMSRAPQKNIEGWVTKKRKKEERKED